MASWCESYQTSREKLDEWIQGYVEAGWNFYIRLFKTNVASTPDKTFADFDWCDFPGSGDQDVNPETFPPAVTGVDGISSTTTPLLRTWTNAGAAQDVWGYAVLDIDGSGEYLGGETFSAALALQTGASITIQLRFRQRSAQF